MYVHDYILRPNQRDTNPIKILKKSSFYLKYQKRKIYSQANRPRKFHIVWAIVKQIHHKNYQAPIEDGSHKFILMSVIDLKTY